MSDVKGDGGEAVEQFSDEVRAVVNRYRLESTMTVAAYVGALECIKVCIIADNMEEEE